MERTMITTLKSTLFLSLLLCDVASGFVLPSSSTAITLQNNIHHPTTTKNHHNMVSTSEDESSTTAASSPTNNESIISKAPTLNGKMVLPIKITAAGLKGHKVAAVYAILDSNYKRG